MAPQFELGYVTDVEGNYGYWQRYIERSGVLRYSDGELQLAHAGAHFVFGGDVVDKDNGDIRIARELVALKRRYPERVRLLVGNRDLNKLRYSAELSDEDIRRRPEDVPPPHYDPKAMHFADWVREVAERQGRSVLDCNTRTERLRWLLKECLGCPDTFEFRRQELAILGGVEVGSISDEAVTESLVVECSPGGSLYEYLSVGEVAAIVGNTLFVHGSIDKFCMGFVPSHSTRFYRPPGPQEGEYITERGPRVWAAEMNKFLQEGLDDHRKNPHWDAARVKRGGDQLMALQNRTAMWGRSVISNCYSSGGVIAVASAIENGRKCVQMAEETQDALQFSGVCQDASDPEVAQWLAKDGICRVVVGHKPCGDCPAVLSARGTGLEVVTADTSFSGVGGLPGDGPRGVAVAVVSIAGPSEQRNQLRLHGVLRDGREHDVSLPALPLSPDEQQGDVHVGTELAEGWWVKTFLPQSSEYLLCRGMGRRVEYRYVSCSSAELTQPRL